MSSEEEYEADWGDSNDEQEDERPQWEIDIENNFYEGDSLVKNEPEKALEKFEAVIKLEKDREVNFGFKAITHVIILSMKAG